MYFNEVYVIPIILIIIAIYHAITKQYKQIKSIAVIFALSFLPSLIDWTLDIKIDLIGTILYYVIIFMAIYFGSALKYYDKFSWWDRIIHFICGIAFISFGIAVSSKIGDLNKLGILIFSFTFSVTLHIFWEIAEYIVDCIKHTNHQRWQKVSSSKNHVSKKAIQPAGLVDTMNDIIIFTLGSTFACIVWYFIL